MGERKLEIMDAKRSPVPSVLGLGLDLVLVLVLVSVPVPVLVLVLVPVPVPVRAVDVKDFTFFLY
jgi:hypothetical protein